MACRAKESSLALAARSAWSMIADNVFSHSDLGGCSPAKSCANRSLLVHMLASPSSVSDTLIFASHCTNSRRLSASSWWWNRPVTMHDRTIESCGRLDGCNGDVSAAVELVFANTCPLSCSVFLGVNGISSRKLLCLSCCSTNARSSSSSGAPMTLRGDLRLLGEGVVDARCCCQSVVLLDQLAF
jgi:hypothetical protein